MKIVHLLGWYFPDSVGGTEVYVEGLCRRLRAAGHDCWSRRPTRIMPRSTLRTRSGPGVPVAIPATPTRDEATTASRSAAPTGSTRWLADERPDILHVHSFTTGVGLPEIREAHRLGIRVIVTCHLPGFGYMCRTGELMQWGRVPCDGIVIAGQVRVVQPDAARHAAADGANGGRGARGARRRALGGCPAASAPRSAWPRSVDEYKRCSASCSIWSIGSSC